MLSSSPRAPRATAAAWLGFIVVACGLLLGGTRLSAQAITITFDNLTETRIYNGEVLPPDAISYTISPPGEYEHTATFNKSPKNAGKYTVKVTAIDTANPKRKATRSGSFTIGKAPLHVSANDAGRLFGAANPKFTFSYGGFLGGDTEAAINKKPTGKTTAKASSPAGEYPITVVGGSSTNYEITTRTPGILTVASFASGTHEALLYEDSLGAPVGKLTLTLPAKGDAFTGRLDVSDETKALAFKGKLALSPERDRATGTATIQISPKGQTAYRYLIEVSVSTQGTISLQLDRADAPYNFPLSYHMADFIARVGVHHKKNNPAPWAGAHTLSLLDPANLMLFGVDGHGYATAVIGADGKLALKGKLPDNTTFTASVLSDGEGAYRVYLRPYGTRRHSELSGLLPLTPHPDRATNPELAGRYHTPLYGESSTLLHWRKEARETDALYPAGIGQDFGAVNFSIALDPWLPPAKAKKATRTAPAQPAITLAQRLGVGAGTLFPVDYGYDNYGEYDNEFVNAAASISEAGKITTASPTNQAKWSVSVNAKTGVFTGKFTLLDGGVTRSVPFQGILRQAPAGDDQKRFGAGYLILPAIPNGRSEPVAQPIVFSRP